MKSRRLSLLSRKKTCANLYNFTLGSFLSFLDLKKTFPRYLAFSIVLSLCARTLILPGLAYVYVSPQPKASGIFCLTLLAPYICLNIGPLAALNRSHPSVVLRRLPLCSFPSPSPSCNHYSTSYFFLHASTSFSHPL